MRNAVTVGFLMLLAFGGVRGAVLGDLRFSWGMFAYEIESNVRYAWVVDDGGAAGERAVAYKPPPGELKFRARRVAPGKRNHGYGIGAFRGWVHTYLVWLWEHRRPPNAKRVQATITWRREREPPRTEVMAYPEDADAGADADADEATRP